MARLIVGNESVIQSLNPNSKSSSLKMFFVGNSFRFQSAIDSFSAACEAFSEQSLL